MKTSRFIIELKKMKYVLNHTRVYFLALFIFFSSLLAVIIIAVKSSSFSSSFISRILTQIIYLKHLKTQLFFFFIDDFYFFISILVYFYQYYLLLEILTKLYNFLFYEGVSYVLCSPSPINPLFFPTSQSPARSFFLLSVHSPTEFPF